MPDDSFGVRTWYSCAGPESTSCAAIAALIGGVALAGEFGADVEIRASGPDVERIAAAHYLGRTYDATTKAEGVGVAIAFLVLSAVFLALAIRRALVARRAPSPTKTTPTSAGGVSEPPSGSPTSWNPP